MPTSLNRAWPNCGGWLAARLTFDVTRRYRTPSVPFTVLEVRASSTILGAVSVTTHLRIRLADYDRRIRTFIPHYDEMLSCVSDVATAVTTRSRPVILDLGIGTGALTAACLRKLRAGRVVGIDRDEGMLAACARRLARVPALELIDADFASVLLPPCDLIVATLALHHLRTARGKQAFFRRCFEALAPSGALITGDCHPSSTGSLAKSERKHWIAHLRSSYSASRASWYLAAWAAEDRYFTLGEETGMLATAGFDTDVVWRRDGFAVVVARKPSKGSIR